jgi:hypothetical protein
MEIGRGVRTFFTPDILPRMINIGQTLPEEMTDTYLGQPGND